MVESLIRFDTDEDAQVDLAMPGCFNENFLKIDLSDLVTYLAITEYYDITKRELEFDFENFQELMKIGYALVLLQISARLMFEKQGFKIENFHKEITFENLTQLVETMNAGLEVGGQPIETSTKYIEGSLSYLRKMAILVHILTDRTREFKKEIKNLSNPASTCEPDVELSTLLNILGFDIQDLSNNFAFIDIVKEVQSIEAPKHQFCENLLEYFNQKCELTKEDSSSKEKDVEMQEEEEKIDPENDKNEPEIKIPDDIIPTNLYLLTPDYYFTLLPLDPTLEQLTKKYYKKECSLCQKLTRRGAICLICGEYLCIASCDKHSGIPSALGNLTKHSRSCGGGTSSFICPIEGQIIQIYRGLVVETKSPYTDKYGECYDEKVKRHEVFKLQASHYNEVRAKFLEFDIPNTVITKRANKQRVYLQNVL